MPAMPFYALVPAFVWVHQSSIQCHIFKVPNVHFIPIRGPIRLQLESSPAKRMSDLPQSAFIGHVSFCRSGTETLALCSHLRPVCPVIQSVRYDQSRQHSLHLPRITADVSGTTRILSRPHCDSSPRAYYVCNLAHVIYPKAVLKDLKDSEGAHSSRHADAMKRQLGSTCRHILYRPTPIK